MSYISALTNKNRIVRRQVITTPLQASGTTIAATIYPWPSFSTLTKITIIASNNCPSAMTVTVISNGAGWRAASGANNKDAYVLASASGTMANNILVLAFSDAYIEDVFRAECLNITLTSSGMTTGTTFTIIAEGYEEAPTSHVDLDQLASINDTTWRVLRVDAAGVCTDLTQKLLRNGNPYGLGSVDKSESFVALASATDKLYIGSARQWTNALVLVPSYSQNALTGTINFWNGSAWATASAQDNTSDSQASASTLSYSGVISIPTWSGSVPQKLAFDPQTVYEVALNDINQNLHEPGGFFYNPARYWAQIGVGSLSGTVKLVGIIPLR